MRRYGTNYGKTCVCLAAFLCFSSLAVAGGDKGIPDSEKKAGPVSASEGSEECTIGVADEEATRSSRVTLWKVRDVGSASSPHQYKCQRLVQGSGDDFDFIGVWTDNDLNEDDGTEKIYMGLNTAGLATANTWVQGSGGATDNSAFQRHVLGSFASLEEVREYLDDEGINQGMHNVTGCFPFIDSNGNAVMFELDRNDDAQYWEYDSMAKARDGQNLLGFVVRANEFHKKDHGIDDTSIMERYHSGTENISGMRGLDELDARSIVQGNDYANGWEFMRLGPTDPANETIARTSTQSAVAVQGAAPGEDPALATMWVILGQTEFGIAVPTWVRASVIPEPLLGCGMYDEAYDLYYSEEQEDVQASVFPAETHIFGVTNDTLLPQWRAEGIPSVDEVTRVENRIALDAHSLLYSLSHYQIGNLAPEISFDVSMEDLTVSFTSDSNDPNPGGSISSFEWVFGDGDGSSDEESPVYTYDAPGTYLVSCTAKDNDFTTTTAWKFIDVGTYKLHLGIDPVSGEDLFPRQTIEHDYYTGSASSLMNLVFVDPEYPQDQTYLYTTYHQGSAGEELMPAELATMLSSEAPGPYHFSARADADQNMAIRRFIHWMDYQVPGVAEANVPALVPVDSSVLVDANWVVVRGFASNIDPCDQGNIWNIPDVELFGVWLNDPRDQGLGFNYYQEAADFMATYMAVEGSFLSIVEPPENARGDRLAAMNKGFATGIHYRRQKPNPRLAKATPSENDDIHWSSVLPQVLQQDAQFMSLLKSSVEKDDFIVGGITSASSYRLVLLGPDNESGLSSQSKQGVTIGVTFNSGDGAFQKASWTLPSQQYVPMTEDEAVKIARLYLKTKDAKVKGVSRVWEASFDTSRFQPSFKIDFTSGETVIVHPDGSASVL